MSFWTKTMEVRDLWSREVVSFAGTPIGEALLGAALDREAELAVLAEAHLPTQILLWVLRFIRDADFEGADPEGVERLVGALARDEREETSGEFIRALADALERLASAGGRSWGCLEGVSGANGWLAKVVCCAPGTPGFDSGLTGALEHAGFNQMSMCTLARGLGKTTFEEASGEIRRKYTQSITASFMDRIFSQYSRGDELGPAIEDFLEAAMHFEREPKGVAAGIFAHKEDFVRALETPMRARRTAELMLAASKCDVGGGPERKFGLVFRKAVAVVEGEDDPLIPMIVEFAKAHLCEDTLTVVTELRDYRQRSLGGVAVACEIPLFGDNMLPKTLEGVSEEEFEHCVRVFNYVTGHSTQQDFIKPCIEFFFCVVAEGRDIGGLAEGLPRLRSQPKVFVRVFEEYALRIRSAERLGEILGLVGSFELDGVFPVQNILVGVLSQMRALRANGEWLENAVRGLERMTGKDGGECASGGDFVARFLVGCEVGEFGKYVAKQVKDVKEGFRFFPALAGIVEKVPAVQAAVAYGVSQLVDSKQGLSTGELVEAYFEERLLYDHAEGAREIGEAFKTIKAAKSGRLFQKALDRGQLGAVLRLFRLVFTAETRTPPGVQTGLEGVDDVLRYRELKVAKIVEQLGGGGAGLLGPMVAIESTRPSELVLRVAAHFGGLGGHVLKHLEDRRDEIFTTVMRTWSQEKGEGEDGGLAEAAVGYLRRVGHGEAEVFGVLRERTGIESDRSVGFLRRVADVLEDIGELGVEDTVELVRGGGDDRRSLLAKGYGLEAAGDVVGALAESVSADKGSRIVELVCRSGVKCEADFEVIEGITAVHCGEMCASHGETLREMFGVCKREGAERRLFGVFERILLTNREAFFGCIWEAVPTQRQMELVRRIGVRRPGEFSEGLAKHMGLLFDAKLVDSFPVQLTRVVSQEFGYGYDARVCANVVLVFVGWFFMLHGKRRVSDTVSILANSVKEFFGESMGGLDFGTTEGTFGACRKLAEAVRRRGELVECVLEQGERLEGKREFEVGKVVFGIALVGEDGVREFVKEKARTGLWRDVLRFFGGVEDRRELEEMVRFANTVVEMGEQVDETECDVAVFWCKLIESMGDEEVGRWKEDLVGRVWAIFMRHRISSGVPTRVLSRLIRLGGEVPRIAEFGDETVAWLLWTSAEVSEETGWGECLEMVTRMKGTDNLWDILFPMDGRWVSQILTKTLAVVEVSRVAVHAPMLCACCFGCLVDKQECGHTEEVVGFLRRIALQGTDEQREKAIDALLNIRAYLRDIPKNT